MSGERAMWSVSVRVYDGVLLREGRTDGPATRGDGRKGRGSGVVSRRSLVRCEGLGERPPGLRPVAELPNLSSAGDFESAVRSAEAAGRPLAVLWTAGWCRKCTFLKPKVARLQADPRMEGRVDWGYVDVNEVPKALVQDLAGVDNMPTFQIWRSLADGPVLGFECGMEGAKAVSQIENVILQNLDEQAPGNS